MDDVFQNRIDLQGQKEVVCPISYVLQIISKKWTVEILREIFIQPTRTRRFLKVLPGLTMKSLMERLNALEGEELIKRTAHPGASLHVDYSVTDKGRDLFKVLVELKNLGSRWLNLDCVCSFENLSSDTAQELRCPHRPPQQM
jgi:DNA-binding HxlR family transcriptional regulator